jgi:hypothetical protein
MKLILLIIVVVHFSFYPDDGEVQSQADEIAQAVSGLIIIGLGFRIALSHLQEKQK